MLDVWFIFIFTAAALPAGRQSKMRISNFDQVAPDVPLTQGWTASSSDRGTFDIIWNSFFTIFLCGWTTICINVPSRRASWTGRLFRKFLVFCEALAGPEFIFHTALSQYLAAKTSVDKFTNSGFHGWTVRHGFYAGMGGFVLHAPDFVPFPLTVDQVYYLVLHGFVDFQSVLIANSEIEDKNKFDTLTRILTTIQLLWFVINVVARVSLGMAITTLELSTIAFIFCTIFTCFFWRLKPQDVSAPIVLELNVPLASVLVSAGDAASRPYSYTPLDFANDEPHWFQLVWRYCFNIPRAFGYNFHPVKRPVDKVWDDQFSHLGPRYGAVLAFVQLSFAAIHFSAWNFHFPTEIERLLWRIAACYISCSMVITWVTIYCGFEIFPWLATQAQQNGGGIQSLQSKEKSPRSLTRLLLGRLWQFCDSLFMWQKRYCNNASDKNPKEDIPLLVALILVPLGVFYICFRGYIILEDIINLRSLPSSTFGAISWASFLPHF